MSQKRKAKSLNFAAGLALGTAVAGAAAFLYQTKKGKKIRKQFAHHFKDGQVYLNDLIKDIKVKAKKNTKNLETSLNQSNQDLVKKTRRTKKKVTSLARRFFHSSSQPLVK